MSRYIVLEGADGCGKSTQARALCAWLEGQGRAVLHVREPGSTPVGEALRGLLLSRTTGALLPATEALLFFAARQELLERVIEPALATGRVVVAERCYLSTLVYQAYAGDGSVDEAWVRDLTARVCGRRLPDRILVLDVSAATAAARRSPRAVDRFEERDAGYHERVRAGFRRASGEDDRIRLVDAGPPAAAVTAVLQDLVAEVLR